MNSHGNNSAKTRLILEQPLTAVLRKTSYDLRVLNKTRTHSTHVLIFGEKIFACPAADWQATVKLLHITTRFRLLGLQSILRLLSFIVS